MKNIKTCFQNFYKKQKMFFYIYASNDRSSFHLTKFLLLHYLGKSEQAKWDKKGNISLVLFPQVVQKQTKSAVEN